MTAARVIEHQGRSLSLDADGHLSDPADWTESLAIAFAAEDGIVLTDDHWWVIRFVRDHADRYGTAPLLRVVIAEFRAARAEPTISSRDLYRLFDQNPVRQACRLGGLPKPDWCI